jgi:hypothetical protein
VRLLRSLLATMLVGLAGITTSFAADIINNPDATTVYLIQCKFSGTPPAYDAIEQADNAVRAADEFHRPDVIKRLDASLRARFASLDGLKKIVVNLSNHFSEYDAQYGEYSFDINDGSFISFNAFGRQIGIALTNGTQAQTWKLTAKDAEDVLRKNKSNRIVTLVLTLAPLESPVALGGEPILLNTKIISYDVLSGIGSAKLGSVAVETKR